MKYLDKLIFVLIEVLSDGTNLETMFESPKAYQLYTFLDTKRKRLETVASKSTCFITTKQTYQSQSLIQVLHNFTLHHFASLFPWNQTLVI